MAGLFSRRTSSGRGWRPANAARTFFRSSSTCRSPNRAKTSDVSGLIWRVEQWGRIERTARSADPVAGSCLVMPRAIVARPLAAPNIVGRLYLTDQSRPTADIRAFGSEGARLAEGGRSPFCNEDGKSDLRSFAVAQLPMPQIGMPDGVDEGRLAPAAISRPRGRHRSPVLDSSCTFHSEGDSPAMPLKNRVKALTSE